MVANSKRFKSINNLSYSDIIVVSMTEIYGVHLTDMTMTVADTQKPMQQSL